MSFQVGQRVRTIPQPSSNGTQTNPIYGIVVAAAPGSTDWFVKYYQDDFGAPVAVQISTTGESCENLLPYSVLWGANNIEAA